MTMDMGDRRMEYDFQGKNGGPIQSRAIGQRLIVVRAIIGRSGWLTSNITPAPASATSESPSNQ